MIPDDALLNDVEFTQKWLDRVRRENAELVKLRLALCDYDLGLLAPFPPGESAERPAGDRQNGTNGSEASADSGDGQ